MLKYYDGFVSRVVLDVYEKDFKWEPWKFLDVQKQDPPSSLKLHREYLDSLAKKLSFSNIQEWYQVDQTELAQVDTTFQQIIENYYFSLYYSLLHLYPEHHWDVTQFKRMPSNYWTFEENRIKFFEVLKSKLEIDNWEEWYHVKIIKR